VLTSDFDFSAHGPFAADAFVATLQSEVDSWGRPERVELFPGAGQVVMVVSHSVEGQMTTSASGGPRGTRTVEVA
jgi:hypothetical protein